MNLEHQQIIRIKFNFYPYAITAHIITHPNYWIF